MKVCLFTMPPEWNRLRWVKGCDRLPQVEHPDTAPHRSDPTKHPHYHPWQQASQPGGWRKEGRYKNYMAWPWRSFSVKFCNSNIHRHTTQVLTKVLCVIWEPDKCSRWPVAWRKTGASWSLGPQQRGQWVQGQAEEGQGAQKQSGAIHHSNRGRRLWLAL